MVCLRGKCFWPEFERCVVSSQGTDPTMTVIISNFRLVHLCNAVVGVRAGGVFLSKKLVGDFLK